MDSGEDVFDECGYNAPTLDDFTDEELETELAKRAAGKHQSVVGSSIKVIDGRCVVPSGIPIEDVAAFVHRWVHEPENYNEDGFRCPACTQFVKIWKRPLDKWIALFVIWLVGRFRRLNDWIPYKEGPMIHKRASGPDYSKSKYFGLALPADKVSASGPAKGLWRPTDLGMSWAEGEAAVPEYVYVFADKVVFESPEKITVHDALKKNWKWSDVFSKCSFPRADAKMVPWFFGKADGADD